MQAFLEIMGITYVVGQDENGSPLPLTRVAWHRYDLQNNGQIGPDHNDTGLTLFVGSVGAQECVTALAATTLPEDNIETVLHPGVTPVVANTSTLSPSVQGSTAGAPAQATASGTGTQLGNHPAS